MIDERRETTFDHLALQRLCGHGHLQVGDERFDALASLLPIVRAKKPLVHCITNYVTANDCANAILAIGASPIMADDLREVADIVKISNALVLNIGTLNSSTVESMIAAGKKANALGIPVIFDPVGAGASAYRNETTQRLLHSVRMTVIRGNLSEVSFIAGLDVSTKGIDTAEEDSSKDPVAIANKVAKEFNCIAAITGAIDTVSDGNRVSRIARGTPELSRVTGTGCMTTALVAAFCGAVFANSASPSASVFANDPAHSSPTYFEAVVTGITAMGMAGEIAEHIVREHGTGSFHIAIIDALSKLMNNE